MGGVIIMGFAAAVVGGFTNLPGAVVGGVVVGLFQSWMALFLGSRSLTAAPFVITMLVLVLRPQGLFGGRLQVRRSSMYGPLPPARLLLPLAICLLGFGLPFVANDYVLYVTATLMMYCVLAVGFDILAGWAGQFAFSHVAFFGIGAYGTAVLQLRFGISFLLGAVSCAALAAAISALIALASVRMRHVYLALATFSFAQAAYFVFQSWTTVTGGFDGLRLPSAQIFGYSIVTDRQAFPFLAVMLAIALTVPLYLHRHKLGRSMAAIRDSEHVAATSGINVAATKIVAFVISSIYASIGGTMLTIFNSYINPDHFDFGQAIMLLTMVAIGGLGSTAGAVVGAIVIGLVPEFLGSVMKSLLIWQDSSTG